MSPSKLIALSVCALITGMLGAIVFLYADELLHRLGWDQTQAPTRDTPNAVRFPSARGPDPDRGPRLRTTVDWQRRGRELLGSSRHSDQLRGRDLLAHHGTLRDLLTVFRMFDAHEERPEFHDFLLSIGQRDPALLLGMYPEVVLPKQRQLLIQVFKELRIEEAAPLLAEALMDTRNATTLAVGTEAVLILDPELGESFIFQTLSCHPLREATIPVLLGRMEPFLGELTNLDPEEAAMTRSWKLHLLGLLDVAMAERVFSEALNSDEAEQIIPALGAITVLAPEWLDVREPLAELVGSRDDEVRRLAIHAAGKLQVEEAVSKLVWHLNTGETEERRSAALALANIGTRSCRSFLRRRFHRERNCLVRSTLWEILVNAGELANEPRPDCKSYCFCGEWGTHTCDESEDRFCLQHFDEITCANLRPPGPRFEDLYSDVTWQAVPTPPELP